MVIVPPSRARRVGHGKPRVARLSLRGALSTDVAIALAILCVAMIPLSYAFLKDRVVGKAYYQRAVAMEIVDGELEVLLAGEWRAYPEGAQPYAVSSLAATNLGKGEFLLTRSNNLVRLEWRPAEKRQGGKVAREGLGR